jgi:hypothetical protein
MQIADFGAVSGCVAALGNPVVQPEIKPVKLVARNKVAGIVRINARKCPVLHLPAGSNAGLFHGS